MSQRRTALITGASSGFGVEFVKRFAADGYNVVLVARNGAIMEDLAAEVEERHGVEAVVLPKDLSEPHAAADVTENLGRRGMRIDALVNNAGFSTYGEFAATDLDTTLEMLRVNMLTLTELTRRCLPAMIEQSWGRILNMGSIASFTPAPMTAAYGATKAYVLSFSLALREELKGTGVTVTALCPGPTDTGFQARAEMADSTLIAGKKLPNAVDVADAGYEALLRGRPYLVTGATSRLFAFGSRFLPRTTASRIAGRSQRRLG